MEKFIGTPKIEFNVAGKPPVTLTGGLALTLRRIVEAGGVYVKLQDFPTKNSLSIQARRICEAFKESLGGDILVSRAMHGGYTQYMVNKNIDSSAPISVSIKSEARTGDKHLFMTECLNVIFRDLYRAEGKPVAASIMMNNINADRIGTVYSRVARINKLFKEITGHSTIIGCLPYSPDTKDAFKMKPELYAMVESGSVVLSQDLT